MENQIDRQLELMFPISQVWRALTDYRQFGEWFKVQLEGPFVKDQTTSGRMIFPGYEGIKFEIVVQKMEPERLFSYTWHPYSLDPAIDYSKEAPTLVAFQLEKLSDGTKLILKEAGFEKLPESRRSEAFRKNKEGWAIQMENLKKYLAGK